MSDGVESNESSQESLQAKVYGQALQHWPKNLFIPPDALAVMLDSFEGPLDLLWYLIRHHRLDVRDIPMVALAEQYLGYIDALRQHTLELAAEYLLMAAWLIEIKARLLLPQPPSSVEEEKEEDPRAALVARLIAYEQMRQGAEKLAQCAKMGIEFESVCVESPSTPAIEPDVVATELHEVFGRLLARQSQTVRHVIQRETLSMRDVMSTILRELPEAEDVEWESLLELWETEPFYAVSLFLGLLQLVRERTVVGHQSQPLDSWSIRRVGVELSENQGDALISSNPLHSDTMDTYSAGLH
jgi:segregation and condensation protein A